ncbi:MAG: bacteriohemerythrin [Methylococcaceae bacterium]|nr:bacteriohemerythrin [Methylococcaceae bacterium]
MSLITWTKEQFGTNVSFADEQHKVLFGMLNDLDAAVPGGDRNVIGEKLNTLVNYVVDHFADEERHMTETNYPDYTAHKAEHTKLLETCGGVAAKFKAGELEITQDITAFVKDWLVNHIPNVDKHYGPHLNSKGIN